MRGDVYLADLNPSRGSEQGEHPTFSKSNNLPSLRTRVRLVERRNDEAIAMAGIASFLAMTCFILLFDEIIKTGMHPRASRYPTSYYCSERSTSSVYNNICSSSFNH